MRYQNWAQFAAIIAVASASPTRIVKQEDLIVNSAGNVHLVCKLAHSYMKIKVNEKLILASVSDVTTNIGTISIHDVVAKLSEACSTQGQCDTNSIGLSSDYDDNGVERPITLTLGPSGAYPSDKHDLLLQVLEASVLAIAQCETVDSSVVDCGSGPVIGSTAGSCVREYSSKFKRGRIIC